MGSLLSVLVCRLVSESKVIVKGLLVLSVMKLLKLLSPEDPLSWISDYQVRLGETPPWVIEELDLPKFTGGLVGYFGYDTIQYVEPRVAKTLPENDPIGSADILLMRSDDVVVFDNLSGY